VFAVRFDGEELTLGQGDVFAVRFDGEELTLGEEHAQVFAAGLSALARGSDRPEVHVDLSNVVTLSTAVLVVLVTFRRQLLAAGRQLVLCNLRPAVAEVLEVTRLNRLFAIHLEAEPVQSTGALSPAA
jgi:anti-anti-sigma factor